MPALRYLSYPIQVIPGPVAGAFRIRTLYTKQGALTAAHLNRSRMGTGGGNCAWPIRKLRQSSNSPVVSASSRGLTGYSKIVQDA